MERTRVTGHVRVEDRKSGRVWVAEYVGLDGRRTRKTLGPAWVRDTGRTTPRGAPVWRAASGSKPGPAYLTPKEADDALVDLLQRERATPPARRAQRGRTWGDASAGWLDDAQTTRDVAPTTLAGYRSMLKTLAKAGLDDRLPLRSVTPPRVESVQAAMLARGSSRKTVHNRMLVVTGVLGFAVDRGWLGVSPVTAARVLAAPPANPDFNVLEPEQVEAVARAITEVADDEIPRMRNGVVDQRALAATVAARATWAEVVRVAAYTGLRFGELRAMQCRDVDFIGEVLRVVRNAPSFAPAGASVKAPKSSKGRSVPLSAPAAAALDRVSKLGGPSGPTDLVFQTAGGAMLDLGRVRGAFYEGLDRAGLGHLREGKRPITFHDLRHTFGTLAVQVFPVTDVQQFLGHADIATTMRYVHHVPRADAAKRLTEAFAVRGPESVVGHGAGAA